MSKMVLQQQLQDLNKKKLADLTYQNYLESYLPKINKLATDLSSLHLKVEHMDVRISKANHISLTNDAEFEYKKKIYRLEQKLEQMDSLSAAQNKEISKIKEMIGLIQVQIEPKKSSEMDIKNKRSQSVEGRGNQMAAGYSEKYENALRKGKLKFNLEKIESNLKHNPQIQKPEVQAEIWDPNLKNELFETIEFRFQEFSQQQKNSISTLEREINTKISSLMEELQDVVSTDDFMRKCQSFEKQIQHLKLNQNQEGILGHATQSVKGYLLSQEKDRDRDLKDETKSVNLSTLFHKTQLTQTSNGTFNSPVGSFTPLQDENLLGKFNKIGLKHSKSVVPEQNFNELNHPQTLEVLDTLAQFCQENKTRIVDVQKKVDTLNSQFKVLKKILKEIVDKANVQESGLAGNIHNIDQIQSAKSQLTTGVGSEKYQTNSGFELDRTSREIKSPDFPNNSVRLYRTEETHDTEVLKVPISTRHYTKLQAPTTYQRTPMGIDELKEYLNHQSKNIDSIKSSAKLRTVVKRKRAKSSKSSKVLSVEPRQHQTQRTIKQHTVSDHIENYSPLSKDKSLLSRKKQQKANLINSFLKKQGEISLALNNHSNTALKQQKSQSNEDQGPFIKIH